MKFRPHTQYKIKWLDAFAEASWTTEDELDKLIERMGIEEQTLYFIKQTKNYYIFTSGRPNKRSKDTGYIDIHGIPKGWLIEAKPIK